MAINPILLEVLACPRCRAGLREDKDSLICEKCMVFYEIREEIPVLLADAARPLSEREA